MDTLGGPSVGLLPTPPASGSRGEQPNLKKLFAAVQQQAADLSGLIRVVSSLQTALTSLSQEVDRIGVVVQQVHQATFRQLLGSYGPHEAKDKGDGTTPSPQKIQDFGAAAMAPGLVFITLLDEIQRQKELISEQGKEIAASKAANKELSDRISSLEKNFGSVPETLAWPGL